MRAIPAAYDGFDRMPIGDSWQPGTAGREVADTDPWSGEVLARIPLWSIDEFTTHHWVSVQNTRRAYPMAASEGREAAGA